jgi:microcystin-dependent protein
LYRYSWYLPQQELTLIFKKVHMDNYLGEVRLFAGNYAPANWAFCNGALLSIAQYEALFALIGTTYGGDGVTSFALPNMGVRIGLGQGQLAGGQAYTLGQNGGVQNVTLTTSQIPAHTHGLMGTINAANTGVPANNLLATTNGDNSTITPPYPDVKLYTTLPLPSGPTAPNVTLDPNALSLTGNSQPHDNMMPYVCINYIIALYGIFPSPQ